MIKAVIFDLDGVLADTEPLHALARSQILEKFGLSEQTASPEAAIGIGKRFFWGKVIEKNHLACTSEELTKADFDLVFQLIVESGLKPTEGLKDLLAYLKESGIKTAVASSSDRSYVDRVLQHFQLTDYFFTSACGDEVKEAKPSPDVYLRALQLCQVSAKDAYAVEDSSCGMLAAERAGIGCIAFGEQDGTAVFRAKTMKEILDYFSRSRA